MYSRESASADYAIFRRVSMMTETVTLKIKKLYPDHAYVLPHYMSRGASGLDIAAHIEADIVLKPFDRALIPTGIAVSLPSGYEIQIRPRSGLAVASGITLLNTPGTIDSDYRGEIKLVVINLGQERFTITNGMRLAQMVVAACVPVNTVSVSELDETDRNGGGFGHTGVH